MASAISGANGMMACLGKRCARPGSGHCPGRSRACAVARIASLVRRPASCQVVAACEAAHDPVSGACLLLAGPAFRVNGNRVRRPCIQWACKCRQGPDCPRNGEQVRVHHALLRAARLSCGRQAVTASAGVVLTAARAWGGKAMHQDLQVRIPA